jgi:hypothetical protein
MRFIAELKDEELLPVIYDISEDISDFVKKTNVLDIRKNLPKEGVTADEQGRQNIKDMLKVICKDYPTETAAILRRLWVLDKGETEDNKPNFIVSLSRLLNERWLIDFFISAVNLM